MRWFLEKEEVNVPHLCLDHLSLPGSGEGTWASHFPVGASLELSTYDFFLDPK